MSEPEEWTPEGLVDHFWRIDRKMHDRRFCFILGAGASVQSGIPAAGALVRRWLAELHQRLDRRRQPLEQWATEAALGIPGFAFDRAPSFYSQVFERRFRQSPDEGYADLEDIMQGKDPSFGYSVLAHILAETRHKLVITTNFDNLVTDALSIFTATSPLVCGHESLAAFIRVVPRRPVVVKIHRDVLMNPMNRADEIATLQSPWVDPLTRIFAAHTPIVIGYGGNDGSLMGFLDNLAPGAIVGGLYWCYYGPGGPPGREICDLVARHDGALVPIDGFDELMLRLTARLGIPLLDQVIETKARTRVESYRRRVDELRARNAPNESSRAGATLSLESSSSSDSSGTPLSLEPSSSSDSSGTTLSLEPSSSSDSSGTALPLEPSSSSDSSEPPLESPDSSDTSETTLPLEHAPKASNDRPAHAPRSPLPRASRRDGTPSTPLDDDAPSTRGQTLEQVLQQVAAETAEKSPLAALTQARLERRHENRLQALRTACARFPRDTELRHALAEELSAVPTPATHAEATSLLESLLADNTDDARAMRHLALLHAWNRRFAPATDLLQRIARSVSFILDPVDAAHLTFTAGLIARLADRDDTRYLSLLKSAVHRAAPRRGLPEALVRHLLDRLDRPSRRAYVRLLSMFADGIAPHRLELVEPRFAAVPPADLATMTPDDFTWP